MRTIQFEKLVGTKIVLQPFQESDITSEYISWLNNPEVVKYSNQRFTTHTKESSQLYLNSFKESSSLFVSVRSEQGSLAIGTMTAYVSEEHGVVDLGIMIGAQAEWGTGYGQDAWNTMINWLMKSCEVRKVTAGTLRCNLGMIKLIERSGMILECTRPGHELLNKLPMDLVYYGKNNPAYALL